MHKQQHNWKNDFLEVTVTVGCLNKVSSKWQLKVTGPVTNMYVKSMVWLGLNPLTPRSDCKFSPLAATHFLIN